MSSFEEIIQTLKGVLHLIFAHFIIVPYYFFESFINLFVKKVPKSIRGEVVLITGAGHGIGKMLAKKYAIEGATVVCWDVNEEFNKATVEYLNKLGYNNVHGYKVDVTNRENVMEAAKNVKRNVGNVTILINNAGIMPHHSFLDHTEQEIRKIIDINVFGHFWTLQAFLPEMRRNNHGHVVCLSSMAGLVGANNLVPYNASKFAVRGLMEGLHEEFRQYPNNSVYFTTVYPFFVDTGLCKAAYFTYPALFKVLQPEYVAEKIYEAQIYNCRNLVLPPSMSVIVNSKMIFPDKANNYITENFKCEILSDLNLPNDKRLEN